MNLTDFTYWTVALAAIAHTLDKIVLWTSALLPKAEAVATEVATELPKLAPRLARADADLKNLEPVPAPEVVA